MFLSPAYLFFKIKFKKKTLQELIPPVCQTVWIQVRAWSVSKRFQRLSADGTRRQIVKLVNIIRKCHSGKRHIKAKQTIISPSVMNINALNSQAWEMQKHRVYTKMST